MKFSYTLDSALKQACLKIDHNQYIVGWTNSSSVDPEQNHKKRERPVRGARGTKMAGDADCAAESVVRSLPLNGKINFCVPDNFRGENQRQTSSEALRIDVTVLVYRQLCFPQISVGVMLVSRLQMCAHMHALTHVIACGQTL